jgi:pimeloyl-ACP methyl ester carboxylesterase
MNRYSSWITHRLLRRPFRLFVRLDQNPKAKNQVLLLHGLGSSGATWEMVAEQLRGEPYHVMAFDLLGFGDSPKPDWPAYDIDDHARAVIKTLTKYRSAKQPATLVGHSMGSLTAVRVAKLRPDLVDRLILYQMPLYQGLPQKLIYTRMRNLHFRIYRRVLDNPQLLTQKGTVKYVLNKSGFVVDDSALVPITNSLQNTIMSYDALSDMKQLQIPIDVIYGRLDVVVIRGNPVKVFSELPVAPINHNVLSLHRVTKRASSLIAKQITNGV